MLLVSGPTENSTALAFLLPRQDLKTNPLEAVTFRIIQNDPAKPYHKDSTALSRINIFAHLVADQPFAERLTCKDEHRNILTSSSLGSHEV